MKARLLLPLAAAAAAAVLAAPAAIAPPAANNALGPLYPVAEESLLAVIRQAAKRYALSESLASDRRARQARAAAYVADPPVRIPVPRARQDAVRIFDPTVTLQVAVRDREGRLLHPAGTAINPLAGAGFEARLVLFDGRDAHQRAFARAQARLAGRTYPILVAGSPAAFARGSRLRAYFDQDGALSRRLEIDSYPAVVTRQGDMLRIETRALAGTGK